MNPEQLVTVSVQDIPRLQQFSARLLDIAQEARSLCPSVAEQLEGAVTEFFGDDAE